MSDQNNTQSHNKETPEEYKRRKLGAALNIPPALLEYMSTPLLESFCAFKAIQGTEDFKLEEIVHVTGAIQNLAQTSETLARVKTIPLESAARINSLFIQHSTPHHLRVI